MRARVVATAALLMIAGCGQTAQVARGDGYRVYEAATQSNGAIVALIDTRTQAAHDRLQIGTPSPDWTHYYTVNGRDLVDIDPETGRAQSRIGLPGDYQLPPATNSGIPGGLSPNGAWLVLQRFDSASHLLVIDTTFTLGPREISLPGRFRFDAISNDGDRLYLIQDVSAGEYHVRVYNVSSSQLDPNFIFDKNEGGEAMSGLRLSGVASIGGGWLFSVYARANQGAFIHALNLDGPFALCLDLPGTGGVASLDWSLALSRDGKKLYASNPAMGVVVELDALNPSVRRTVHPMAPATGAPAGAVVSADNHTLVIAGTSGITWMDTITLTATAEALPGWAVRSLALSPDGKTLYAVNDKGELAELSMATRSVLSTFDPVVDHPIALMRVEAVA